MPHVHFLGDVRGRVVDDDGLGDTCRRDTEALVGQLFGDATGEERVLQCEVDEPGPRYFDGFAHIREVERLHDALCDLPRWALETLGESEGRVDLKIRAIGRAHHRVDVGEFVAEGRDDGRLESLVDDSLGIVHTLADSAS